MDTPLKSVSESKTQSQKSKKKPPPPRRTCVTCGKDLVQCTKYVLVSDSIAKILLPLLRTSTLQS